jgi:hypothetical protein
LDRAASDDAVAREISAHNHLYELSGAGTIPKLLTDHSIINGEPASLQSLFEVLEQHTALTPAAAGADGPEAAK